MQTSFIVFSLQGVQGRGLGGGRRESGAIQHTSVSPRQSLNVGSLLLCTSELGLLPHTLSHNRKKEKLKQTNPKPHSLLKFFFFFYPLFLFSF